MAARLKGEPSCGAKRLTGAASRDRPVTCSSSVASVHSYALGSLLRGQGGGRRPPPVVSAGLAGGAGRPAGRATSFGTTLHCRPGMDGGRGQDHAPAINGGLDPDHHRPQRADRPGHGCGCGDRPLMLNTERHKRDVIVIGASAGGVPTLIDLFSHLGMLRKARVAVVLHRSPVFEGRLPEVLGRRSALSVMEPHDGAAWEPRSHLRGAPGSAPRRGGLRRAALQPRAQAAPHAAGRRPALRLRRPGIRSEGGGRDPHRHGDDGVRGLIAISVAGGVTLVQSPSEAPHPSMPRNALARDHVAAAIPMSEMPAALASLVDGRPIELRAPATA